MDDINLKHIMPRSVNKKLKLRINDLVDTFVNDSKLLNPSKSKYSSRDSGDIVPLFSVAICS